MWAKVNLNLGRRLFIQTDKFHFVLFWSDGKRNRMYYTFFWLSAQIMNLKLAELAKKSIAKWTHFLHIMSILQGQIISKVIFHSVTSSNRQKKKYVHSFREQFCLQSVTKLTWINDTFWSYLIVNRKDLMKYRALSDFTLICFIFWLRRKKSKVWRERFVYFYISYICM